MKELGAFGVVGMSCFLLDVGLFQVLYTQLSGAGPEGGLVEEPAVGEED